MAGFLAGLGAALTEGSSLAARARAERRQAELDRQQREMELARMALERRRADLAEQSFTAEQGDREYGRVKDILAVTGPGTEIDDALAARAESVGLGGRLTPAGQMTLPSRQFGLAPDAVTGQEIASIESPAEVRRRAIVPTFEQQGVITDRQFQTEDREFQRGQRETQRRAQEAINQPGFWKLPETQRAIVWGQTGFGGQLPMSFDEWKSRQDYEQGQALARINASARNMGMLTRPLTFVRDGKPITLTNMNDVRPTDIPYDEVAARGGSKPASGLDFGALRGENIRQTIQRLRGDTVGPDGKIIPGNRINRSVVGVGSVLSYLPESPARMFAGEVESLKSNIIQKSLQEMRDASKTGGALGQVSDFENRLLSQSLGALDRAVSPEDFQQQLKTIEEALLRWEEAKVKYGGAGAGLDNGISVAPGQVPDQGAPGGRIRILNVRPRGQ